MVGMHAVFVFAKTHATVKVTLLGLATLDDRTQIKPILICVALPNLPMASRVSASIVGVTVIPIRPTLDSYHFN
jgi:hypothetical protein